jgi:iron(III) transport system substrate-binding protein
MRVSSALLRSLALCAVVQISAALAADSDIALYQGDDRHERLVQAAKKEGELSIYHVYPALPVVMAAFTKKYGIKARPWRAGSEAVLQRISTEARAGRHEVDIVQNNAPENEAAHREKLLQRVRSPYQSELIPQAVPAHGEWVGITLDVWTAAYNTDKVRKEELPRTYQDLLAPRWKDRLGIEAFNHGWFATLLGELGEKDGLKLFSDIVATNGISVRKGHSLLTSLVASGEVPFAITVYSWNPVQSKKKGAPIEGLALQPLIGQFSTIAMLKKSPHPNAAVLFYDFMLNEGQQLLADADFVPASKKLGVQFGKTPLKFVDPGQALDMQDRWVKMYEDVITKKAK